MVFCFTSTWLHILVIQINSLKSTMTDLHICDHFNLMQVLMQINNYSLNCNCIKIVKLKIVTILFLFKLLNRRAKAAMIVKLK